jgi:hypothetical protein
MDTPSDSILVVAEKDLLHIARIARSTWHNWISKHFLGDSSEGHYRERHVISALVAALVVDSLDFRRAHRIWGHESAKIEDAALALAIDGTTSCDLVIDLHTLETGIARSAEELHDLTHPEVVAPRGYVVVPVAAAVREARRVFWKLAVPPGSLKADRRTKSSRKANSTRTRGDPTA